MISWCLGVAWSAPVDEPPPSVLVAEPAAPPDEEAAPPSDARPREIFATPLPEDQAEAEYEETE